MREYTKDCQARTSVSYVPGPEDLVCVAGSVAADRGRAAGLPDRRRQVDDLALSERDERHPGRPDGPRQDSENTLMSPSYVSASSTKDPSFLTARGAGADPDDRLLLAPEEQEYQWPFHGDRSPLDAVELGLRVRPVLPFDSDCPLPRQQKGTGLNPQQTAQIRSGNLKV